MLCGSWRPGAVEHFAKNEPRSVTIIKGDGDGLAYFLDNHGDELRILSEDNLPASAIHYTIDGLGKRHEQSIVRMTNAKIGNYQAILMQPESLVKNGQNPIDSITAFEWQKNGSDPNYSLIIANAQYKNAVTNADLSCLKAVLASIKVDPASNTTNEWKQPAANENENNDEFTFMGIPIAVLLRDKTIHSLHELQLDMMMYEEDNGKFPDMSSAATVKKALLGPYASGNYSAFTDAFDHLPFEPNPALSNLPVDNNADDHLPVNTVEYYQAKPLADGSRCVCYATQRDEPVFVSRQTWSQLIKLPMNSKLPN